MIAVCAKQISFDPAFIVIYSTGRTPTAPLFYRAHFGHGTSSKF